MLLYCGSGKDSWNSLGQQGDQTSQNVRKSILNIIGRPDAEAPIVWPPDAKNWLIGKDPDAAKDWGQKEKGITEDEMVPWHHQLNSHVSEQTPGDSERQGSLACCSPWCRKMFDTTLQLNNNSGNDVRQKANSRNFLIWVQNGSQSSGDNSKHQQCIWPRNC